MGTLGVICEVSLKVLPQAARDGNAALQVDQAGAVARLNGWPVYAADERQRVVGRRARGHWLPPRRSRAPATLGGEARRGAAF